MRIEQVNFEEAKPLCGGTIYNGIDWFTESSSKWDAHYFKTRGSCFLDIMFKEISVIDVKANDYLVCGT